MDLSVKIFLVLLILLPFIMVYLSAPLRGIMYMVAFQKIIDILWFIRIPVGITDLTVSKLIYTVIPFVVFVVIGIESQRRKFWPKIPELFKILVILYLTMFAVGAIRGPLPGDTFEMFIKVFSGFSMFFAGWYYFDSEEKFDEFSNLYVVTYLIPFVGLLLQMTGIFQLANVGIEQQLESSYGLEYTYRYSGFYHDSGTNTMYLWSLIPLVLYFLNKRTQKRKWFYGVFFLFSIFSVVVGFSRGAYLMFTASIVSWLFINKKYISLLIGFFAISIYFISSDFLRNFFADFVYYYQTGKFLSVSGKAPLWDIIMEEFEKGDVFEQLFGKGLTASYVILKPFVGRVVNSESDWYNYRYDLGYFGILVYILTPLVALIIAWKNIKIVDAKFHSKNFSLKYKVFFAMMGAHFVTLHGSGSRWVSFTVPLWFVAGFALKHPAYYASGILPYVANTMVEIKPRLKLNGSI